MNNKDLAALAALGAMGFMYKKYLDGQGTEASPTGERYPPVSDFVNRGALGTADAKRDIRMGGFDNTPAGVGVGTAGVDKRSDMDDFAVGTGIQVRGGNEQRYRDNRGRGKGGGSGAGNARVLGGTSVGSPFANRDSAPDVVPDVAPEESSGMGGAGLAAGAGLGAAGAGAAAYYARLKAQARAMKPRPITGDLSDTQKMFAGGPDKSPRAITGDLSETQKMFVDGPDKKPRAQSERLSETKEMFAKGPDRAAAAQAQADAEAKSRAIQAEIDDELKRLKSKTKGAGVNKSAATTESTVTSETAKKKRAPVKVETPTDMDDFNRMLRESKVGRATTTAAPAAGTPKVRNLPGKLGLAATALGLGTAANAATDMTAGQRERLLTDVGTDLLMPLSGFMSRPGEGSDLGFSDKPLSSAERKKMIEAMSPADRKKMEEALARQNPGLFDGFKRPSAANKKAAGGQIKTKKMASGGMTSTVSLASKRGDGIASKGKTRCKMY